MHILADATLPLLSEAFPPPFHLTRYHNATELQHALPHHRILICRSTLRVNQALLGHHRLAVVMTASSGRDHLDEPWLTQQGTVILDAKGSNAHAVVDYMVAILQNLQDVQALSPRTLGIIGMGAVGSRLYQRLQHLLPNLEISVYDPWRPELAQASLDAISRCEVICLHPNLHDRLPYPSFHLINQAFLEQCSPHTVIINASRGDVVHEEALLRAYPGIYCTDVFSHEPAPNPAIIKRALYCTPHIAGHTVEAKFIAIQQLSQQLHHHYQRPSPHFTPLPSGNSPTYSPTLETQVLKAARDLPSTFVTWRAAHYRHNSVVFCPIQR